MDDSGQTQVEYIWLDNQPLAVIHTNSSDAGIYYIHNDHLNTPQVVSDSQGNRVWQAHYSPFGQASIAAGSTLSFNLRFPGQYFDTETGLHYNYYRVYDPATGRYIQSDPIGLAGGLNTYGYVGGNPLGFMDPLGLAYSPLGEHGISREKSLVVPLPQEDSCGCLTKAFLGYTEASAIAIEAVTGPYVSKPRSGIAGGRRAGSKTSVWSTAIHQINIRAGKSAATVAARTIGRVVSRAVPYAGTALLIYDITVFNKCMENCEEGICEQ